MTLYMGIHCLQKAHYFNKNALLTRTLSMTLRMCAIVLLHVWSYDFYDTMLSLITVTSYDERLCITILIICIIVQTAARYIKRL